MRRVASMPLIPGRLMSISTRPGASGSNSSTASSPDSASPTTSKPGVAADDHARGAAERGLIVDDQHATAGVGAHDCHSPRAAPAAQVAPTTPEWWGQPLTSAVALTVVGGEVDEHRLDPAVHVGLLREAELREQRVDVLLDRPLREPERGRDPALLRPCAISASTSLLAGREALERRVAPARPGRRPAPRRSAGRSPSRRPRPRGSRAAAGRRRRPAPSGGRRGRPSRARAARARTPARRTGSAPRRRCRDACSRSALAARTPSSVPVGGMRMSVSTTSGSSVVDGREQLVEVAARADDLDARAAPRGAGRRPRARGSCLRR